MRIRNPFNAVHVKVTSRNGKDETVSVQSNAREIEIPDDAKEALLEALQGGRSDSPAWSNRMWVKDRGVMEIKDYQSLLQIEEDRKRLEEERAKDKARKEKEARERAEVKKSWKKTKDEELGL